MKQVYLTIDDAPSRDFKAKMEYLHQHSIPAIFFCEGQHIEENGKFLPDAVRRGFILGNHAFSHPRFSELPLEECKREILRTDEMIENVYRIAGVERPAKYFRFPYFDDGGGEGPSAYGRQLASSLDQVRPKTKRMEIQEYLRALGYRHPPFKGVGPRYYAKQKSADDIDVCCTYDQQEYRLNNENASQSQASEAMIMARIEADDPDKDLGLNRDDVADIILLHDHVNTTELFYKIIARYIEKGFQFLDIPFSETYANLGRA